MMTNIAKNLVLCGSAAFILLANSNLAFSSESPSPEIPAVGPSSPETATPQKRSLQKNRPEFVKAALGYFYASGSLDRLNGPMSGVDPATLRDESVKLFINYIKANCTVVAQPTDFSEVLVLGTNSSIGIKQGADCPFEAKQTAIVSTGAPEPGGWQVVNVKSSLTYHSFFTENLPPGFVLDLNLNLTSQIKFLLAGENLKSFSVDESGSGNLLIPGMGPTLAKLTVVIRGEDLDTATPKNSRIYTWDFDQRGITNTVTTEFKGNQVRIKVNGQNIANTEFGKLIREGLGLMGSLSNQGPQE